jgi:hypothetical protein
VKFQKPLETLTDVLQVNYDILYESLQVPSAYLIEEELDNTVKQRIAGMILYIFLFGIRIVGFICH